MVRLIIRVRWQYVKNMDKLPGLLAYTKYFSLDIDLCKLEGYNPRNKVVTLPHIKHKGGSQMPEEIIGKVSDFFARPVVAGIELIGALKTGDKIHITGHTTDMELVVDSMQINNTNVAKAKAGDSVGIKVPDRVRRGDNIYKVT